jgi:hypothetical protein
MNCSTQWEGRPILDFVQFTNLLSVSAASPMSGSGQHQHFSTLIKGRPPYFEWIAYLSTN